MGLSRNVVDLLPREGEADEPRALGEPGQRPVIIAAAIAEPRAVPVKAEQWNQHDIGSNPLRPVLRRERAEPGLVKR